MKKILSILLLCIMILSTSGSLIVNASEAVNESKEDNLVFTSEELKYIHQNEKTKVLPYREQFETKEEAEEYRVKLDNYLNSKVKNSLGRHSETDNVGNTYKWVNNNDIGNPATNGYGQFRAHIKNGTSYSFKFNGHYESDSIYFITLDEGVDSLPANLYINCIQPDEIAEWIDDTTESNSAYQDLSATQKRDVNRAVSYAIYYYDKTGNFDYLSAGQLSVWEAVGGSDFSFDSSIQKEWDDIHNSLDTHTTIPSFSSLDSPTIDTPEYTLTYNKSNTRYEVTLHDTNAVLDDRYLDDLVGTYGVFHVEDGLGDNNLLVWVDKSDGYGSPESSDVISEFNPMPSSGEKNGIKYSNKPTFVNSGQDLVTGLTDPIDIKVKFKVKEAKGSAYLDKQENNDEAINGGSNDLMEGVEFGLYNADDDTLLNSKITDSSGHIEFTDLPLGSYYIQEISTNVGYQLNADKYYFEIDDDGVVVEINGKTIENYIITGKVHLTKVGETPDPFSDEIIPLAGAEFEITDEDGNVVETLTTDNSGEITSSNLAYGKYTICETKAPDGYINSKYCEDFEIVNNGEVIELNGGIELENKIIKGKVELNKIAENFDNNDSELYPLEGAEFTIYLDVNENREVDAADLPVQVLSTDENGYAIIDDLKALNKYIIVETKAPTGYLINEEYIESFEITEGGQIITLNNSEPIVNEVIKGQVELTKGGKDKIEENKHDTFIYYPVYADTNLNGIVDKGEDKAIDLATQEKIDSIYNTEDYIVDMNQPFKDKNNLYPLGDSEFTIYQDLNNNRKLDEDEEVDDNIQNIIITDEYGYGLSKELKYGNYIIKETTPTLGYENLGYEEPFSILNNKEVISLNKNKPIQNNKIYGNIELIKLDSEDTSIKLEGAEFTLYKDLNENEVLDEEEQTNENIVDVQITNSKGRLGFENIEYGKYILKETKAPNNYEYNDDLEIPIFVEKQDQLIQIYVTNEKIEEKEFLHTGRNHIIEVTIILTTPMAVLIIATVIIWRKYE